MVVAVPSLSRSWQATRDRAALAHGHNVFKAAWAYMAEEPSRALVTGDCAAGYTAGSYSVPNPGGSVRSCTVRDRGDGTPEVEVVSQSGRTHRLP
ncbi:type II secretion system protein [Thermus sp.]|uniref:type II secretion system protein n=1 Tax=Thermus sp. TaxID=275 RepID=UPI00298F0672|nr:type II secretion system protein [Thermus sp.]MDW8358728.1 type II secretion system protein [Thermus sp.]